MRTFLLSFVCLGCCSGLFAQDLRNSPWHIVAEQIDPNEYYGVTVANGMMGLVSSAEPMKVHDVVLNGVYDYYQRGRVSNILKAFNHIDLDLILDGVRVARSSITDYRQVLDMQRAILTTSFRVPGKGRVVHQMLALRHLPYTAMSMVEIIPEVDMSITVFNLINAPDHLTDVRNFFNYIDRPHVTLPLLTSVGNSPSGRVQVAASSSFIFEEPHGQAPRVIHEDWDYNRHWAKFTKQLRAGEPYRFSLVGTQLSSVHYDDPYNEAERLTVYAALEGKNRLLQRHEHAWAELWEGDIQIEGDLQAQKDVRFALYHLYSFAREGSRLSLSPMGLSGLGYNGHVFWDTELWMYPPLLMLNQGIAKSLLDYRFDRMDAARQNAFAKGFRGVMFPWESAAEGSEDTPVWALTGPFQHHITADVGWAYWKYYQTTQDKEWLRQQGYPMLKEVADFWVSRVERKGPGRYEINNVIGANEWEENIDNNAFTNGMAKVVLEYASQAAELLGLQPDPEWRHVAANIPIETFPDGTTRENSSFEKRMIKQADVNLLAFPVGFITDRKQIEKDLDFYEPLMSPDGPAMGFSVLAALYARLGRHESVLEKFYNSYRRNQVPPFGVISEAAGGTNPYFATGAGGMLQAIMMGIGGLDFSDKGIIQLPYVKLPAKWKSLKITGVGPEKKTFEVRNK